MGRKTKISIAIEDIKARMKDVDEEIMLLEKEKQVLRTQIDALESLEQKKL